MKWNRKKLLALLASQGFKAEGATLDTVKAFITEKNLELADGPDSVVDVDAAWKNEADDEAAPVTKTRVVYQEPTDYAQLRKDAALGQKARAEAELRKVPGVSDEPQRFSIGNSERKSYAAKVATHGVGTGRFQAKFADVDVAEACTAMIRLAIAGQVNYSQKSADTEIVKAAGQYEASNTAGGYLVPPEYVAQLLYSTEPHGIARKIANVVRMSREVQMKPRKTGIASFSWVGEQQSTSVVADTYDQVELIAKKMQLILQASNELFDDSAISVADCMAESVNESYDITLDDAYLLGDGTSTYGGFVGLANGLPSGAYFNASGAWSAFVAGDFHLAMGRLQNIDPRRVICTGSRQFYHQVIQRLNLANNQFKEIAGPPGMAPTTMNVLGVPFYEWQRMPTATGSGVKSFYIGDFVGATMIGERRDLNIMTSEHSAFSSDSIQWRATARASIAIHGDGRTPATTYGPIVCLKATG